MKLCRCITNQNGLDITDQTAREYSVKSASRRWPVYVFFNILYLAGINSWILYKPTTGENITRKEFLFLLADELASEEQATKEKSEIADTSRAGRRTSQVRKWFQIGHCNNNKTNTMCSSCNKYVFRKNVYNS